MLGGDILTLVRVIFIHHERYSGRCSLCPIMIPAALQGGRASHLTIFGIAKENYNGQM